MNQIQTAYVKAKKQHDVLAAELNHRIDALWETEPARKEASTGVIHIEEELDYWPNYDKLLQAEADLLGWGHEQAKTDPRYAKNQAVLERVFAHPKARDGVIAICLKLTP